MSNNKVENTIKRELVKLISSRLDSICDENIPEFASMIMYQLVYAYYFVPPDCEGQSWIMSEEEPSQRSAHYERCINTIIDILDDNTSELELGMFSILGKIILVLEDENWLIPSDSTLATV